MLTLFTIPKAFRGHIGTLQQNAIRSWTLLRPACEIILLGDDEGTAEVAREFGLHHIPNVARNGYGTPLLNSIFEQAQAVASHRLLVYVNADIILLSDFIAAVRRIPFRRFLMVGQRWDMNLDRSLDFSRLDWEGRLRECVRSQGTPQEPAGMDYFVFTSGLWGEIPPFAVGRGAWDNWLIYQARAQGAVVVDATHAVMVVHQNHDYAHIQGGQGGLWKGPEAQRNLELPGGNNARNFALADTTWALPARGVVRPVLSTERLLRHLTTLPAFPLPAWRFHLMRGLLLLVLAWQEKRLMRSIVRRAKRILILGSR